MRVLVTGGAGYIGSHVTLELLSEGHEVVVLDDLSTGKAWLVPPEAELVEGRVGDAATALIRAGAFDGIVHLAGSISVPESMEDPLRYYDNNVEQSRRLVEAALAASVPHFVFSSSAAVYGAPSATPIDEDVIPNPINPYGRSKLMTEWLLADAARVSPLRSVRLRYFNVAGADPEGRSGQAGANATHIIKRAVEVACGVRPGMEVYGGDHDTRDGTCVRDYIHVSDLARAHVLALGHLAGGGGGGAFNCGYGHGYTNLEVLEAVRQVSGREIPHRIVDRRAGDPPVLIADPTKARRELGFEARRGELHQIVQDALAWERTLVQRLGARAAG